MLTSATCHQDNDTSGFTLLELIVVMAIAGMLAAVALPGAGSLVSRAQWNANKDDILVQINSLGFQAYSSTMHIELPSAEADQILDLPDGWSLTAPAVIQYHPNGFCSGGKLLLHDGNLNIELRLQPPLCKPELLRVGTDS